MDKHVLTVMSNDENFQTLQNENNKSNSFSNYNFDGSPRASMDSALTLNLQANFEQFLIDIKANLSKCKYRKTLDDIKSKESLFVTLPNYWRITNLK